MRLLTLGTFDLLHVGHVRLLQRAARFGDLLVGVNSDRFAAEYKRAPVIGEADRMVMVEAVKGVNAAYLNDGPGRDLIQRVKPDCLVVGSDWHQRDYLAQIGVTQKWLDDNGVACLYLPRTPEVSSTEIRGRL